jgi:hypothetical protein
VGRRSAGQPALAAQWQAFAAGRGSAWTHYDLMVTAAAHPNARFTAPAAIGARPLRRCRRAARRRS